MADNQTGYADDVLGQDVTGKATDSIVDGDELWRRNTTYGQAVERVDLISLTDAKRAGLGGPLSVGEKLVFSGVADFIERFRDNFKKMGLDANHMAKAFQVDVCLEQDEEANDQVRDVSRAGVFILTGEMTSSSTTAETAAATLKAQGDETLGRKIDMAFSSLVQLRQDMVKSAAGQRTQSVTLRNEHTASSQAEQQRQLEALARKKLASAPLPKVSPLPGKTKKPGSSKKPGKKSGKKILGTLSPGTSAK